MRSAGALTVVVAAIHLSAAAAVIRVHVAPVPAGGGEIVIRAADDPAAAERVVSLSSDGVAQVDVKTSSLIAIRARAAHLWSPERVVLASEHTDVALELFPTGVVRGRMAADHLPASIDVGFEPVQTRTGSAPSGRVVCPLTREGAWECEMPEGVFDLRLHVTGFIPVFRTGITVAARHDVDVGVVPLRQGASVAGRVRTIDGGPLTPRCQVKLVARSASMNSDKAARDESLRTMKVSPDARGRFQFVGVPPGSYDLVVTQPGYADTWRRRIPVVARTEAMLSDAIALERPAEADILVSPSSDPAGRPWIVRLFDADGSAARLDPLVMGATEDGHRLFGRLSPGRYFMTVSSGEETWFSDERTILAHDEIIHIDVPLTRITGRVTLGERGLPAQVTFFDSRSTVSISLRSNEEGELTGVLPRRESWDVKVAAPDAHVLRTLRDLKVEPRGETSRVTIDLPDTTVKGMVLNADGTPHGDGFVSARDSQSHQQAAVSPDGTFAFSGFDGDVTLQATATGERASDQVTVHVTADTPMATAVLKLRPADALEGRVMSATGPVPGSRIFAMAASAAAGVIFPEASNAVGEFRVRLLDAGSDAFVTVMSPGYALWHGRLRVGGHAEIMLNQLGGTLKLRKPADSPVPYVEIAGTPILYAMLVSWSKLNGSPQTEASTLTIGDMPAGSYLICLPNGGLTHTDLRNGRRTGARCAGGVLSPMGELVLDLTTRTP